MAYYKLYFVEAGKFRRFEDLRADDDVQAVREAAQRVHGATAELWSGARKVKIFTADNA